MCISKGAAKSMTFAISDIALQNIYVRIWDHDTIYKIHKKQKIAQHVKWMQSKITRKMFWTKIRKQQNQENCEPNKFEQVEKCNQIF